ncbi:ABC transporter substrate-binding protein [Pseudonocardia alaniniphila]|uniref:ABC transporter substrate-binding protein n=2 Tax=Pseudonocardia alaniniphila TaxID=75291 RepID=A0ABS9T6W1_9PSEU|nr:ABC transporter substrate-binding protein [Pseudonocardia alaniniphila]MCH6164270.1 ABC transporter substrate-binding protein [Pseudonocardia alaniniphila]
MRSLPVPFRRRLPAALLAAVAVLGLAACGSGGTSAQSAADAGPPQPGGTLAFAVSSDQGCLDPQQVTSNDSIYSLRQIVDSLTDQNPDTGEIVPWLATGWQINADATEYTFDLRPGVTFSDGTPLDAAAVKANFDKVPQLGARGSLPKGYLANYQGTTVESPTRFTVTFSAPNVQFLQGSSTHSLGILSPATVAKTDDERCAAVIGSGPFVVQSYTLNQSTVLTKRAGYDWGSALSAHTGEAYLDGIEFRVVPESGVRTGSLQSGEVDAVGSIGQQDEAPLTAVGVQLPARANPGIPFGISFNLSKPIVSDPAVRQAISLAINRPELVGAVYTSQTKPATSVLASSTPSYQDESALLGFDPAKAAAVLDADGWASGPDGIRTKAGQALTIPLTWFANAGTNRPALELIQQQLKAVGIDLQLGERPITDATPVQQSGNFVATWGNLTRADPDILRSQFATTGNNFYRLSPGPLDGLLAAQAAEADPAKRTGVVGQAQQVLLQNYYTVPVVELTTVLGVAADVHGVRFDASSRIQLYDAWKAQ